MLGFKLSLDGILSVCLCQWDKSGYVRQLMRREDGSAFLWGEAL